MLSFVGCATEAPVTSRLPSTDKQPDPVAQCAEGDIQACECSAGASEQVCSGGAWGECACLVPDTEPPPGPGGLRCKAGYYVGDFKGKWKPGIGDFPPFGTLISVTITASDVPEKPGLALTLEKQVDDEGGEFEIYSVKNGCLVGTASSGEGQNHPFIGTITGSLRCDTGEFEGHVDGYYELFGLGELSKWFFAGSMTGQFDSSTSSLEMGTWDLREKQSMAVDGPGGTATWQASFEAETGPELPPECLALIAGADADAGI